MSQKNKKILILTTRENNVWLSMQEIIPALEKVWTQASQNLGYKILTLNAEDTTSFRKIHKDLLTVDMIFVTAFNVSIAQKLVLLRKHMFIDAPWVFQLHNQATVGLWPLFSWGMGELLRTKDRFISTSLRDAKCFNELFVNSSAEIVPFPALHRPLSQKKSKRRFCYMGRLSAQKNIHTLLWAYSLYIKEGGKCQLDIFGGEDDLGSPNMGIKSRDYKAYLKELCQKLEVDTDVNFLGQVERSKLHEYWSTNDCVMVSAGLHSDENFGMALLQGLTYGHCAVITDWGGHSDFLKSFSGHVIPLKVYESKMGPYLDVVEFSQALIEAENTSSVQAHIPKYYTFDSVVQQVQKVIRSEVVEPEKMKHTKFLDEVLKRVELYKSQENGRVFKSYQDTLAHKFFRLYGMENKRASTQRVGRAPWSEVHDEEIISKDPHRGEWTLTIEQAKECGVIQ